MDQTSMEPMRMSAKVAIKLKIDRLQLEIKKLNGLLKDLDKIELSPETDELIWRFIFNNYNF